MEERMPLPPKHLLENILEIGPDKADAILRAVRNDLGRLADVTDRELQAAGMNITYAESYGWRVRMLGDLIRQAVQPVHDLDLSEPDKLARTLYHMIASQEQEHFIVVCLDSQLRAGADDIVTLYVGAQDRVDISPKDVAITALRRGASRIVLAHNHPSGNPEPTESDIAATYNLTVLLDMFDISIVDHLVFGRDRFCSMAAAGLLDRMQPPSEF